MRILLIEDDTLLGTAVQDQIIADGHSIDWVAHLDAARDHLGTTSYGSVQEIARIVAQIRKQWPHTRITLRADSGFARDPLMV
jgi:hypothetical protein